MSKENVSLLPEFQDVLRFYGYDLVPEITTQIPTTDTHAVVTTTPSATITTTVEQPNVDAKEPTDLPDLTTSTNIMSTSATSITTDTTFYTETSTNSFEMTQFSTEFVQENTVTTIIPVMFQTDTSQSPDITAETTTLASNNEETDKSTIPVSTQSSIAQNNNGSSTEETTLNELTQENTVTTIIPEMFQTDEIQLPDMTTETTTVASSNEETNMMPTLSASTQTSVVDNSSGPSTELNEITITHISQLTDSLPAQSTTPSNILETSSSQASDDMQPLLLVMNETVTSTEVVDYATIESDLATVLTSTTVNEKENGTIQPAVSNDNDIFSTSHMNLATIDDLSVNDGLDSETVATDESVSRQRREVEGYRTAWQSTVSKQEDIHNKLTCQAHPCYPFLVDGLQEEYVPVMSFTTTFRFAYLSKLQATALEFPLDNDKYKLLLILPVDKCGLRSLIYSLSLYPLRLVYEALVLTRVNAVIPSFMAEGDISLSTSLKKLGIWDIFDPKRANLTSMSDDPELYVRNIEQTIKVNIRNYMDSQNSDIYAYGPIERFYATHPFLYFVLDKETHVSLILGKISDPLSKKIN